MGFWIKTNRFVKWIFPNYVWDIPNHENKVFLTFDDGPTPEITEWTLEQLKKFDAKATFFCIGNNIAKHPEIFKKVIQEGHAIGNHTFNHLKGWKTTNGDYIKNTTNCAETIHQLSTEHRKLFRPPYGKIKPSQSRALRKMGFKIIMWDIISYDFDAETSKEKCLENVLKNVRPGSIIVFHDSVKAEQNLKHTLPKTLEFLKEKGYICAKIELD
jgi:peptidoglycan/xylan/chitin deacetylase (PgdA/CDA1 family)